MGNDLHVTGIQLKNYLTWKKKALNPHCFCFVLVFLHYLYYHC